MMPIAANATVGFIGLFSFLAFFVLVILSLIGPRARAEADQHAQIPFKEGEPNG